jgi:hypothetical protein
MDIIFSNLTRFVPLSFEGEGERDFEGALPLQTSLDLRSHLNAQESS